MTETDTPTHISFFYGTYDADSTQDPLADNDISVDFILPLKLMQDWSRCSLISDFLAQYESISSDADPKRINNILSTVINELLENAVKFSLDKNKLVNLRAKHKDNHFVVETITTTDYDSATKFIEFLDSIDLKRLDEQFLERIENNADHNASQLGMLCVIKDYEANIGVKIQNKLNSEAEYEVFVKFTLDEDTLHRL